MALINCPECGKEISDTAENCPNCGYHLEKTKFCKFCGEKISAESVVCVKCGRQIEELRERENGGIVINNNNNSSSSSSASSVDSSPVVFGKMKNKWTSLLLCIFLGYFGAHKFYEGKIGTGILYLFTMGLFGIGWLIDIIAIALKPNPYYV